MDIREYEELIISELNTVVCQIIDDSPTLPISVKRGERVGDGVSKYLENKFVEMTDGHIYFRDSIPSPEGKTKNPFDVETIFELGGRREKIWIDFKSINLDNKDTNPDSGTPDKVLTLIQSGNFYLVYVLVYYRGIPGGLSFVEKDDVFVKSYFLKDISNTMRITPSNQIQVNGFSQPVYRSREEFLKFLLQKKIESNERKLKKCINQLENLRDGNFNGKLSLDDLIGMNNIQEDNIRMITPPTFN
jgi:hypothetical protein